MPEFPLLVCFVLEVLYCSYCIYIYIGMHIKKSIVFFLVSMRCVSLFNILVNR